MKLYHSIKQEAVSPALPKKFRLRGKHMILTNALKTISRAKGRNILIGIIVFAVTASSCVALAIKTAADDVQTNALDGMVITAQIQTNTDKLMSQAQAGTGDRGGRGGMNFSLPQSLTESEYAAYAQSDYVLDYYFSKTTSLAASDNFEAYTSSESSETDETGEQNSGGNQPGQFGGGQSFRVSLGDFTLTGVSSASAISTTAALLSGSEFDYSAADNQVVISSL
jgi:putative ABC transport system permease protein